MEITQIIKNHKESCEVCNGGSEVKYVEYEADQFRADGTKINKFPWEITAKEYEFYKIEMPRRYKRFNSGKTIKFRKLEQPKFVHFMSI